jgi:hypothetical protein
VSSKTTADVQFNLLNVKSLFFEGSLFQVNEAESPGLQPATFLLSSKPNHTLQHVCSPEKFVEMSALYALSPLPLLSGISVYGGMA